MRRVFRLNTFALKHLFYISLLLCLTACGASRKLSNRDLQIYKSTFSVQCGVFHEAEGTTLVVGLPAGSHELIIEAFETYKGKTSLYQHTRKSKGAAPYRVKIPVPIGIQSYVLNLKARDVVDGKLFEEVIAVTKSGNHRQTILLKDTKGRAVINTYIPKNEAVQLSHYKSNIQQLYVRHFPVAYRPAPPPFAEKSLRFNPFKDYNELFTVQRDRFFTLDNEGLYFIQTDTTTRDGVFISCFDQDFPRLTDVDDLTLSIRYIATNKEYGNFHQTESPKQALDDFWLNRTSDKQQARTIISTYYNRIQQANIYFSSYKEGWKTDRGLIYVVYGHPDRIRRTENLEYWFYKSTEYRSSTYFYFDKIDGQAILRRDKSYNRSWDAQIYEWREGLVK